MEIRLLGPLVATVEGKSIVPTAGKPRRVLALLALYADQVIPVPQLIEEIWGTEPPRSALTTLQTYIMQLRRKLDDVLAPDGGGSAKDILVTRHGGYLLAIPPESVDAQVYEKTLASAHTAFARGDDEAASVLFGRALGMWRGPALVDVAGGPLLTIEVTRLQESRLGAMERRIDADLRLGRHGGLLSELTALTRTHPLHEGLHGQCMIALYRSGRQWQALETYSALRARLVDELGVEPSPRLQRLHQALLAADPALDVHLATRPGPVVDLFAA